MIMGMEAEYAMTWEHIRSALPHWNIYGEVECDSSVVYLLKEALGWLPCGGRLYVDMSAFLEFASPECASIRDIVRYDKAGEKIVWKVAMRYLGDLCEGLDMLKTSADPYNWGWTKGAHENYLVPQQLFDYLGNSELPFTRWFLAFIVTRQILAGAGWLYLGGPEHPFFSIAQRSHLIHSEVSLPTTSGERGIINLKNEGHVLSGWSRLHMIVGDLNRCDWSLFLKVGTTAMMLEFLADRFTTARAEERWREFASPIREVNVVDPVNALWLVSRDLSTRSRFGLFTGPAHTAWEVQDLFCETLTRWYDGYRKDARGPDSDYELVLAKWREVLDALKRDPHELAGILDWTTKLVAIEELLDDYGVSWQMAEELAMPEEVKNALASFDHSYSSLNPDSSVFEEGVREGVISRAVSEADIAQALVRPPRRTRAFFRGNAVRLCTVYAKSRQAVLPEDVIHHLVGFGITANMDWGNFVVTLAGNHKFSVPMPEPWNEYRTELEMLKEFIQSLSRRVIVP